MELNPRVISISDKTEAEGALRALGVHPEGIRIMAPKLIFKTVLIKALNPIAANIIKQEMLSRGGEAAVSHGAIDLSAKRTDVLVSGTLRQFGELLDKLASHQFGLLKLAGEIKSALLCDSRPPRALMIGKKRFQFGKKTYIMGILNVTPDSFSDGGKYAPLDLAVRRALQMEREGADIIDVGGESTRPGARPLPKEEEMGRVVPVIKELKRALKIPVSIDTRKSQVARAALKAGASLVNDVSGLHYDKKVAKVAADFDVPLVVMHMRGSPRTMQRDPRYGDLFGEMLEYLSESIRIAEGFGLPARRLIVDPGIGFGKTVPHNLQIISGLRELKCLGLPIMVGASRKSVIGNVLGLPVSERLEGGAAVTALAISGGADIIRAHDVREVSRVARMADAIVRR